MKIDTNTIQSEIETDTSIEDARWLLGAVCFIGAVVIGLGMLASFLSA